MAYKREIDSLINRPISETKKFMEKGFARGFAAYQKK